ncbi:MAG: endonuclease V [Actinophytocola sp.]|uniref:endonuclease V n=1 Tax=Actinophytocola sp. TaxID=1872138 RepID=UPI003C7545A7
MLVPSTVEEAVALQSALARSVVRTPPPDFSPRTAAGLDVAYAVDSPRVAAAVVTVDIATGEVLESATAVGEATFPYVPGLFAFRELPTLLSALGRLRTTPVPRHTLKPARPRGVREGDARGEVR